MNGCIKENGVTSSHTIFNLIKYYLSTNRFRFLYAITFPPAVLYPYSPLTNHN